MQGVSGDRESEMGERRGGESEHTTGKVERAREEARRVSGNREREVGERRGGESEHATGE